NSGVLTITNSSIHDNINQGYRAGGIYTDNSLTLINTTVSHNSAPWFREYGGGIYAQSGTLTLDNVTVAYNYADGGGGIYSQAVTSIQNSIIGGNTAVFGANDCEVSDQFHKITLNGYNIIGTTYGCQLISSPTDQLNADPQLATYPIG